MMRDLPIIFGLCVAAALAALAILFLGHSSARAPAPVATASASAVPFTELAHGVHSTVTTRTNYLIRSNTELVQLWKMIDAPGAPPAIDFATDSVIALFAGDEPSAGYAIAVSGIQDGPARRLVQVVITKPGVTCLAAQTVTDPYQIVSLPQTTLPLSHEDSATTTGCLSN